MRQSNYKNGFLLLELCVALACLAILLPTCVILCSHIKRHITTIKSEIQTLQNLENNLEVWRYSGQNISGGEVKNLDNGLTLLTTQYNDTTFILFRK